MSAVARQRKARSAPAATRPTLCVAGNSQGPVDPDILELYRRWLSGQGLGPNTIRQRVAFLERVLAEWGTLDRPPFEVAEWVGQFTGWTRRTYLAHLKSIYAYVVEEGSLEQSPLARYRTPPEPSPAARPLPPDKVTELLDAATGEVYGFMLLGLYAGLRCHEIAKVHGRDVEQTAIRVLGKGGRDAVLPTHPLLWEHAQRMPRDGYWFPSTQSHREHVSTSHVGNTIRAHFRAHGVAEGSAHRLRYTFGTTLARAGVQVRVVQELLRHQSLDTTMRYVAVDDAEKADAIRLLGGVR